MESEEKKTRVTYFRRHHGGKLGKALFTHISMVLIKISDCCALHANNNQSINELFQKSCAEFLSACLHIENDFTVKRPLNGITEGALGGFDTNGSI
jgi:hypothetical protein